MLAQPASHQGATTVCAGATAGADCREGLLAAQNVDSQYSLVLTDDCMDLVASTLYGRKHHVTTQCTGCCSYLLAGVGEKEKKAKKEKRQKDVVVVVYSNTILQ